MAIQLQTTTNLVPTSTSTKVGQTQLCRPYQPLPQPQIRARSNPIIISLFFYYFYSTLLFPLSIYSEFLNQTQPNPNQPNQTQPKVNVTQGLHTVPYLRAILNWVQPIFSIIMVIMMLMMAKLMTMTFLLTIFTIIDGQDDDFDYTTININHGYGNDFELDHIQL